MSTLEIYELLKPRLGDKESKALVEFVQETSRSNLEDRLRDARESMATKADLANLKAELLKWMFLFWVGQIAAVAAIVKVFLQ